MELGIKVLEVPTESIKASLFNHKGSIQAAAHDVLSTWFMGQNSGQEAYVNLLTGLKRAEMSELAAELQYWVEGIEVDLANLESAAVSQITDKGKKCN